ncbi:HAD-like protein [Martensiomyces pterosporus]|nr:HAD-like protein [Martensiomyces pterosporus]
MVHYESSTKAAAAASPLALRIRGVVFDMDGTLVTPMNEYLKQMRRELGIPNGIGTLAYVETHMHGEIRERAERRIMEIEADALAHMELSPGLVDLLRFLKEQELPTAIITRNNMASVNHFLDNVVGREPEETRRLFTFSPVIDRHFKPTKPHPHSLLHISKTWGIPAEQLLMVGDHADDLACGIRAGSVSALLRYPTNTKFESMAHITVDRIDELVGKLSAGFEADMTISGEVDPSVCYVSGH